MTALELRREAVTLKGEPAGLLDDTFTAIDRNIAWLQSGLDGALTATVAVDRRDPLKCNLRTMSLALHLLREDLADLAAAYLAGQEADR